MPGRLGSDLGSGNSVEDALVAALAEATEAGRFDVVVQLAKELEARRKARSNVVDLEARRRARK
jgi:hypothetical protein